MELMSSGFLPFVSNRALPTLDCNAENLSLPLGSQSSARFTALLQRLHTPSKSMMGRLSDSNTRRDVAFGSRSSGCCVFDVGVGGESYNEDTDVKLDLMHL